MYGIPQRPPPLSVLLDTGISEKTGCSDSLDFRVEVTEYIRLGSCSSV